MAKKEPLQTARFGHEATRRQRVLIFQDKGLPERVLALAQHAVRFEFIINDNGGRDNVSIILAQVVDSFAAKTGVVDRILRWFG